jgi:uracil-DNA glycosylase
MDRVDCDNCPLANNSAYVGSSGRMEAKIFIVGAAPGEQDAEQRTPFAGPAGSMLKDVLGDLGVETSVVRYTNVVRRLAVDKNGKTRKPTKAECNRCGQHLASEMRTRDVDLFLALGQVALEFLVSHTVKISDVHGLPLKDNRHDLKTDYVVVPVYDPGYILRSGGLLSETGSVWLYELQEFARMVKYV